MKLRNIIFWCHLAAGVVAGGIIAVMCFTGVMLAFEKEIIAWAERDVRRVEVPAGAAALSLDDLLAKVRQQQTNERPSAITIDADPGAAVLVGFGRAGARYVNPYTGEVFEPKAKRTRQFMQTMITWHRYLGSAEESRARGKAITGACNLAFLALAISGLYLWWPRKWTREAVRSAAVVSLRLRGKARDWNWHNAVGVWCAPILIILTATALPISYRWAGNLIYKLTGSTPPPQGAGASVDVPAPPAGASQAGYDTLLAFARKEVPDWKQITFRLAPAGGRGGRPSEARSQAGETAASSAPRENSSAETSEPRPAPQAVTVVIKEKRQWPPFTSTQISLNPFTAETLRKETFESYNTGRKVRSWTRYLHTGEALGPIGQAVAGIASLGGLVLTWTGLALALRRFLNRKAK